MGIFKSLKKLFSKKSKKVGEKVDAKIKPEVVITNRGIGSDASAPQTTFNTDGIDILVEEGMVENVSDQN
jgi:hypothetical protein